MSTSLGLQETSSLWKTCLSKLSDPVAATMATMPVYYGFKIKSALQAEHPFPKMPVRQIMKESLRESPTIGIILGAQLVAQDFFEKRLNGKSQAPSNFYTPFISAALVGGVTAPLLAIFNGRTLGLTTLQAVKNLSGRQVGALMVRETAFLASVKISEPINHKIKQKYGANKALEYGITFFTAQFGAILSQPFDTYFTRLQKGLETTPKQYFNGGVARSLTVAGFAVGYKGAKELLQKLNP